jgi:hypothetical protein
MEAKFIISKTMQSLTIFIEKSINIYYIKEVNYENIFHNNISNEANLKS